MVTPLLETACALQLYSVGLVIAKTKPSTDDVISPNNSPFLESVITVYTFPCQSAGGPLSAFLLLLAAGAVYVWLKQTFFPGVCTSVPSL